MENSALMLCSMLRPQANVEPLQLENTDIELTERGAIKVDDTWKQLYLVYLRRAMSMAVTDSHIFHWMTFRILYSYLAGDGSLHTGKTVKCPYQHVHHTPPLAQIGLTEAQEQGCRLQLRRFQSQLCLADMCADLRGALQGCCQH